MAPDKINKIFGKVYYDYEEGCLKGNVNRYNFYFEITEEHILTFVLNSDTKTYEYLYRIKLMYTSLDKPIKEWSVVYPDNFCEYIRDYPEEMANFAICDLIKSSLAACKE